MVSYINIYKLTKDNEKMKLILTLPPFVKTKEIVENPSVEAVRVNTTLPVNVGLETIVSHAKEQACEKPVWVDLKCRQLRIKNYWTHFLPTKEINCVKLNHKIDVSIPTEAWFDNGRYLGNVTQLKNNDTLIMESSVEQRYGLPLPGQGKVGIRPGMSINILNPSLKILDGYLTKKDKDYLKEANKQGIHTFMISFLERESDITDIFNLDPNAQILAKVETKKGLEFIKRWYPKTKYKKQVNLIAARGDGYTEMGMPDKIIDFCEGIIKADPKAVFASRIFESLEDPGKVPECRDLFDVYSGKLMGYKRFLIGDNICAKKDSLAAAVGLFEVLANKRYKTRKK